MTLAVRRSLVLGCGVLACWVVVLSCRELSAPVGGVMSLSPVRLPSPGVVVGDTMRDSTGAVAPLRVVAYDEHGDSIPGADVTFVVLDSGAHVVEGNLLVGDIDSVTVRVIASAPGVQTKDDSGHVKITLSPDTLVPFDSTLQHYTYTISGTTLDTARNASLNAAVRHRVNAFDVAPVEAVIVRYTIERAPVGQPGAGPTAVLLRDASTNVISDRDTSDVSGNVGRVLHFRMIALAAPTEDTVEVRASASYKGQSIGEVLYILIFTKQ
jgi:hypothetical protein